MPLFCMGERIKFHVSQSGGERFDCRERWEAEETDLEARVMHEWCWLW